MCLANVWMPSRAFMSRSHLRHVIHEVQNSSFGILVSSFSEVLEQFRCLRSCHHKEFGLDDFVQRTDGLTSEMLAGEDVCCMKVLHYA